MNRCAEEEALLFLCGLGTASTLSESLDWNRFWELARLNAVELQVVARLDKQGLARTIPEEMRQFVQGVLNANRRRVESFSRVLDALTAASVPVGLLKGAAFGAVLYGDLSYKRMNDVDILIPKERSAEVVSILQGCGFRTLREGPISGSGHHTLPYFDSRSKTVIGLHWHLTDARKHPLPVSRLWEHMERCAYNGREALTFTPEMHLLHLCLHLPFLKTGLRELADVCHLIQRRSIQWERFFELAEEAKAEESVTRVLTLANSLVCLGQEPLVPPSYLRKCRPFVARETAGRKERLLTSRSTLVTQVERWFVLYTLTSKKAERLQAVRQIWSLLFARVPLFVRGLVSFRPFSLLRVLALEHGAKKVTLSLLGLTAHALLQYLGPEKKGEGGLMHDESLTLFWELE